MPKGAAGTRSIPHGACGTALFRSEMVLLGHDNYYSSTKDREQDRRCDCTAMSAPVSLCQACGVDVTKNKKNRYPLSGKDICPTLTEFATDAVKSLPSSDGRKFLLNAQEFQAGYVCRGCYRELLTLHTLEKQLHEAKEAISNKVAKAACHLPTKQVVQSLSVDQNEGVAQSSRHLHC